MNQARSDKSPSSISTKQMRSSEFVSCLHKEWARNLRERVSRGEPFAITNVSQAEEIFTVMDIPYIPTQWWSAYISAKRLSPYYFDLLGEKGYDLCRYCSLPLGCTMRSFVSRGETLVSYLWRKPLPWLPSACPGLPKDWI